MSYCSVHMEYIPTYFLFHSNIYALNWLLKGYSDKQYSPGICPQNICIVHIGPSDRHGNEIQNIFKYWYLPNPITLSNISSISKSKLFLSKIDLQLYLYKMRFRLVRTLFSSIVNSLWAIFMDREPRLTINYGWV